MKFQDYAFPPEPDLGERSEPWSTVIEYGNGKRAHVDVEVEHYTGGDELFTIHLGGEAIHAVYDDAEAAREWVMDNLGLTYGEAVTNVWQARAAYQAALAAGDGDYLAGERALRVDSWAA